jgi:energy-coupling factor transporter transmembrane protein EcfT
MKRVFYLLLPIVFLVISVPWFFVNKNEKTLFGMPDWVIYSLIAAASFAILMTILIGFFWNISSGESDDDFSK